ncbi:hypothetical protein [uncultured Tateyamaria sp.]|uniref:hypothetical protein n=1 Tax=uncultured Tateyamaria sp. TaxID=455651 RepID=UPI0026396815|nr:hypothetical protein [uncultured Tateyamaria sp.]
MTPDETQSLVARCLTDPDFLSRAQNLEKRGLGDSFREEWDAVELLGADELERIRRFRGFITKVKHSAIRRHIPATLALMGILDVEHSFFCDISVDYVTARADGPLEHQRHLDLISSWLDRFLDMQPEHIAIPVAETFAHEQLLFSLGQRNPTAVCTSDMTWHGTLTLVPKSLDVVAICSDFVTRTLTRSSMTKREHVLCYWHTGVDKAVLILEVDLLTAAVFSSLKSGGSLVEVQDTMERSGLPQVETLIIKTIAAKAAARGFVTLHGNWLL